MYIPEKFPDIPSRDKENESLTEYAARLSGLLCADSKVESRKVKGQFFTPTPVSKFMAGLFDLRRSNMRLLDPGAGAGVLSAAFCERVLETGRPVNLEIDAYEKDLAIIPYLASLFEECEYEFRKRGLRLRTTIILKDFLLSNEWYLGTPGLFESKVRQHYNFVISNPPYYKVAADSSYAKMMAKAVCGQPNIYALFMTLSASMLAPNGEMVFITPRSFCSGLYYRSFRKWFLNSVRLSRIHIFESRKDVFESDEVLQENIILKAKKKSDGKKVLITTSHGKDLETFDSLKVNFSDIVSPRNGESFIRIPTKKTDLKIIQVVDKWPCTLNELGFEISTGPVVDFRAREFLRPEITEDSVPLIWMHNLRGMRIEWPKESRKPAAILNSEDSKYLLLPLKNYVLLKRFTSKEQKRRLDAAVLKDSDFHFEYVGIENHVNYVHKPKGSMSLTEAFGIAALLNTAIIDNFFRSLNGHTQVNATEIRNVPLPSLSVIKKIGSLILKAEPFPSDVELDKVVADELRVDRKLISGLEEGRNGKNRGRDCHPDGVRASKGPAE